MFKIFLAIFSAVILSGCSYEQVEARVYGYSETPAHYQTYFILVGKVQVPQTRFIQKTWNVHYEYKDLTYGVAYSSKNDQTIRPIGTIKRFNLVTTIFGQRYLQNVQ